MNKNSTLSGSNKETDEQTNQLTDEPLTELTNKPIKQWNHNKQNNNNSNKKLPKFNFYWIYGIVAVLLINSIQVTILDLIFLYQVDYMSYLINSGFTFLFYPLFFILFNILNSKISLKKND